jgi:hypothetical protein
MKFERSVRMTGLVWNQQVQEEHLLKSVLAEPGLPKLTVTGRPPSGLARSRFLLVRSARGGVWIGATSRDLFLKIYPHIPILPFFKMTTPCYMTCGYICLFFILTTAVKQNKILLFFKDKKRRRRLSRARELDT